MTDSNLRDTTSETTSDAQEDDVTLLTTRANRARARLLRTVDALDRKRHDAMNLQLQVRKNAEPIAIGAGVILLAFGGLVVYAMHRVATRAERRQHERFSMLKRMWRHPERTAKAQPRGFFAQLARNVLLGVATSALMIPAKHLLAQVEAGAKSAPTPQPTPTPR